MAVVVEEAGTYVAPRGNPLARVAAETPPSMMVPWPLEEVDPSAPRLAMAGPSEEVEPSAPRLAMEEPLEEEEPGSAAVSAPVEEPAPLVEAMGEYLLHSKTPPARHQQAPCGLALSE